MDTYVLYSNIGTFVNNRPIFSLFVFSDVFSNRIMQRCPFLVSTMFLFFMNPLLICIF